MESLLIALNEGLIDKKNLLLKKYKSIFLEEKDVLILLNILNFESNLNFSKILKKLDISKKELELFLTKLTKQKLLKWNTDSKEKLSFDLNQLWIKLLATVVAEPDENSNSDVKYKWFISNMNIVETNNIKEKLLSWIKEDGFEHLKEIVFNFKKLGIKNVDFSRVETLYKEIKNKPNIKDKEIKEAMQENWLND